MSDQAAGDLITFNGINGATGGYLTDPTPIDELVQVVKKKKWGDEHFNDLSFRMFGQQADFRVLPEYGDGSDLKKVGWGIIFPAGADPAQVDKILEAMDDLIKLRQGQAGKRFKVFKGADGYQWKNGKPESKNDFLVRHGASAGPVDPNIIPFYLLIIADPQSIPFSFQYEMDVQHAVGRIYFQTLAEYARYAASVVAAEQQKVSLARRAVFFGVANPGDRATSLSAEYLVKPLHKYINDTSADFDLGWKADLVEPDQADRETLKSLLGGSQTPAFLFTASHGMAWPYQHELQHRYQGALVCQDWKGPKVEGVRRDHFLAAEDIPDSQSLLGTVVFHFACFGAGTPYKDEYAIAQNQDRTELAVRPFLAALPMRLLSHPNGGALAVIGHIERAWSYSFSWGQLQSQTQAFQSVLYQLMDGKPVGMAMDDMNVRYAEIATMLSNHLQEVKYEPQAVAAQQLLFEWTANNDARGYAILGDPAVRISAAPPGSDSFSRPQINLAGQKTGVLPVVFAAEALEALSDSEKQAVAEEDSTLQNDQSFITSFLGQETGSTVPVEQPASDNPASGDETRTQTIPPVKSETSQAAQTQKVQGEQKQTRSQSAPVQAYTSPMDGLAFALQVYASDQEVSFSVGLAGESFSIVDDTKEKIREVVVNLNTALGNLARRMQAITSEAATLQVTTGVVDDLKTFDPQKADWRFVTRISPTGDIEVYIPRQAEGVDEVLLAMHKEMVNQALNNRLELAKAIGETIANLFTAQKP